MCSWGKGKWTCTAKSFSTKKGLASHSPQAQSCLLPAFVNKTLLNTVTLTHLRITSGCFASKTELHSCLAHKAQHISQVALYRKGLLTPGVAVGTEGQKMGGFRSVLEEEL